MVLPEGGSFRSLRGTAQRQRGAKPAAPEPRQELGGAQRGATRRGVAPWDRGIPIWEGNDYHLVI